MIEKYLKLPTAPLKAIRTEYPIIQTQFYVDIERPFTPLYTLPQQAVIGFNHKRSAIEIIKGESQTNVIALYHSEVAQEVELDIESIYFDSAMELPVNMLFCNIAETQGMSQFQFNYNLNYYPSQKGEDEKVISLLIGGNYQSKPLV